MAIILVPSQQPTIAAADAVALSGDTIQLAPGYVNETAAITKTNLTITGDASNTGIVLNFAVPGGVIILGGTAPIRVNGGAGAQTIVGNDGNNLLTSGGGLDTIDGAGGDDTIDLGSGHPSTGGGSVIARGGSGTDTLVIDFSDRTGRVFQSSGIYYEVVGESAYVNFEQFERFNLTGGSGDDALYGGALDDTLRGGGGNDALYSGVSPATGSTTIVDGGSGTDYWVADLSSATTAIAIDFTLAQGGLTTLSTGLQVGNVEVIDLATGSGADSIRIDGALRHGPTGALSRISTGAGNDTVDLGRGHPSTGGGSTQAFGGDGTDTLVIDFSAKTGNIFLSSGIYYEVTGEAAYVRFEQFERYNLTGGSGNDALYGVGLNDTLRGGAGADTLLAGGGDDVVEGGAGADTIDFGAGNDTLSFAESTGPVTVDIGAQTATGTEATGDVITGTFENAEGGAGDDTLTGDGNANVLSGLGGADILTGGGGTDSLNGGGGDDRLIEAPSGGTDTVDGGAGFDTLAVTFDEAAGVYLHPTVIDGGGSYGVSGTLAAGYSGYFDGTNPTNLRFFGIERFEFVNTAATGDDIIVTGDGADLISTGGGADSLGGAGGNDTLFGGEGSDTMDGGLGDDSMEGGLGNDVYVVDAAGDVVNEAMLGGAGDEVRTSLASYTAPTGIEILTGTSNSGQALTGQSLTNTITGGGGNDTLDGGDGADSLTGGAGNDLLNGGAGDDSLDTMVGGLGDDVYIQNGVPATDVIVENADEGTDEVRTNAASYGLTAANVENLTGTSNAGQSLSGSGGANVITGADGNDSLLGFGGNDTLNGGLGADTLSGGLGDDVINGGGGADLVNADLSSDGADSVNLGAGLDAVNLSGNGNQIRVTFTSSEVGDGSATDSNTQANQDGGLGVRVQQEDASGALTGPLSRYDDEGIVLTSLIPSQTFQVNDLPSGETRGDQFNLVALGTSGNDLLSPGVVASTLNYYVNGGQGNDTLNAADGNDWLVGGAGADLLMGAGGNDTLGGGAGADTMEGGLGNDLYFVDAAGDVVNEAAGEGVDEVRVSLATYTLATNVEVLTGTSAAGQSLTGNALGNLITGLGGNDNLSGFGGLDTINAGAGADTLDGGLDSLADVLTGGVGDDTYVIEEAIDQVVEAADGGVDTVLTTGDYTLGAEVENLTGFTTNAHALTGNGLANVITGSLGVDTLNGAGGDDTLIGGGGGDILTGGAGADRFRILANHSPTATPDVVQDFNSSEDKLDLTGLNLAGAAYVVVQQSSSGSIVQIDADANGAFEQTVLFTTSVTGADLLTGVGVTVIAGAGDQVILGTTFTDALAGGDGADQIAGNNGNDSLYGQGGDDVVFGQEGNDFIYGGAANDALLGGNGNDAMLGEDGNDSLFGEAGTDLMYGQEGADGLYGGADNDTLIGGAGDDAVVGEDGNDQLFGDAGADLITGGAGVDLMFGGADNDLMIGGDGTDTLYGEIGADELYGEAGADTVYGGDGNDLAFGGADADLLLGGAGADTLNGEAANDQLFGDAGADLLIGADGADSLFGGDDGDQLLGQAGADILNGEAGGDVLTGGAGADTLTGGAGGDLFVFAAATDSTNAGFDVITDFVSGSDVIDLSLVDANATVAGDQAFVFVTTSGVLTAGQARLTFDAANNRTIFEADVDGVAGADLVFVTNGNVGSAGNFLL